MTWETQVEMTFCLTSKVFVFRACRMTTQKPVKRRKFNIQINPLLKATKSPVVWGISAGKIEQRVQITHKMTYDVRTAKGQSDYEEGLDKSMKKASHRHNSH